MKEIIHAHNPLLFLRKPPSKGPSRSASLNPVVCCRFDMYERGDLRGLIRDYERDVVLGGNVSRGKSKSEEDEDFEKLRAASEFLAQSQYSRARRHLQSFGLGDHTDPEIIRQMETKHPKRKEPIKPLTEEQLGAVRKGLDRKRFMEELGRLKYNTVPGLGGLRNEHITALKLNPRRIMTPSASVVLDHYYAYTFAVMKVELPL